MNFRNLLQKAMLGKKSILFVGSVVMDTIIETGKPLTSTAGKEPYQNRREEIGGGAANAALAAAALVKIFDIPCHIIAGSKIGHGPRYSTPARRDLENQSTTIVDGIDSRHDFEIPQNFAVSGTDDRRFYVDPKSYPPLDKNCEEKLRQAIQNVDAVHIHTRLPDLAVMAARLAHEENRGIIALDASSYNKTLDEVLPLVTHAVLPDELEIPGIRSEAKYKEFEMLKYLAEKGVEFRAIMRGGEPTIFNTGAQRNEASYITIDTPEGFKIVDKVGAGDVARAAMMLALVYGKAFPDALQYANAMATFSCAYHDREWIKALPEQRLALNAFPVLLPH